MYEISFANDIETEPLVVLFYFPLLVSLGAGSSLSPQLKKVCRFSGNISYPLYMTHYAAIWIFGNYFTKVKPPAGDQPYFIIPGGIILVGFAYLVIKFYDNSGQEIFVQKKTPKVKGFVVIFLNVAV